MRNTFSLLALSLLPVAAHAAEPEHDVLASAGIVRFELGGAAGLDSRDPTDDVSGQQALPRASFQFPQRVPANLVPDSPEQTAVGDILIYRASETSPGREVIRLGTAVAHGRATTGVYLIYAGDGDSSRSELFLDYALTDTFRISISGIMSDEDGAGTDEPVARMGVSAAYALDQGAYVQGGIADARDTSAVFGLAVGFRF